MVSVIFTHEVRDFSKWKKGFEGDESSRSQAKVKVTGVFHSVENPNMITVTTEFPSLEAVHGFISSPALKAAMEKAGVVGSPEIKILTRL